MRAPRAVGQHERMQPVSHRPAPPPPPVVSDQLVRPSRWWFAVAGAIAAIGVVAAVVFLVQAAIRYTDAVQDFERARVPAELDVHIEDPGGYTIYHEYSGADTSDPVAPPELVVEVTDPSGSLVAVREYSSEVTYDVAGHEGRAVYSFHADEPGVYHVSATSPDSRFSRVAVGRGFGAIVTRPIVTGVVVGVVAVAGAVVLAIVVGVKRSASRRRLAPPPVPGAWVPAGPGFGPPGPPGAAGPLPPPGAGGPAGYPPPPGPGGPSGYPPPPGAGGSVDRPPPGPGGSSGYPPPPGAGGA